MEITVEGSPQQPPEGLHMKSSNAAAEGFAETSGAAQEGVGESGAPRKQGGGAAGGAAPVDTVRDDPKIFRLKRLESMTQRPPKGFLIFKSEGGAGGVDVQVKEGDAIPILLRILRSIKDCPDEASLQEAARNCEAAAHAMWRLASSTVHKEAMLELGAAPLLVELLRVGTPAAREKAAGALGFMAVGSSGNKSAIMDAGAVPLLVELISSPDTKDGPGIAAGAIGNLAVASAAHQAAIAAEGAVPPLVALLENGRSASQENAAGALWNLSVMHVENQALIGGAGAVPLLVRMMRNGAGPAAILKAAGALRSLAALDQNKLAIAESGGIPELVGLLLLPEEECPPAAKEHACDALWAICRLGGETRKAADRAGVLSALIGVIRGCPRTEVQEVALGMLGMLVAGGDAEREAVAELGGVEAVVAALASESPAAQSNAAGCIGNLAVAASDPGQADKPYPRNSLPDNAEGGAASPAARRPRLISHLARQQMVLAAGAVPLLLRVLQQSPPAPTKPLPSASAAGPCENAAGALWNLALANPAAQRAIFEAGGIRPLVQVLSAGSAVARENAAGALWCIVMDGQSPSAAGAREQVADEMAAKPLLALIGQEAAVGQPTGGAGGGGREEAAGVLWSLSLLDAAQTQMLRAGAVASLCRILTVGGGRGVGGRVRWAVAATLANLSYQNDEVKRQVAQRGAAPHLVAALKTGRGTQDAELEGVWRRAAIEARPIARKRSSESFSGTGASVITEEASKDADAFLQELEGNLGLRNRANAAAPPGGTHMGLRDAVHDKKVVTSEKSEQAGGSTPRRAGGKRRLSETFDGTGAPMAAGAWGARGGAPGVPPARRSAKEDSYVLWFLEGTKYQLFGHRQGVYLFTPCWIMIWICVMVGFLWNMWSPMLFNPDNIF